MSADITTALNFPPPGVAGTLERTYSTAVGATTSGETDVLPNEGGIPDEGCWVTWIATTNSRIRVGIVGVGAAVATDFFLPAGVPISWYHQATKHNKFQIIQDTAVGFVLRYRSNR